MNKDIEKALYDIGFTEDGNYYKKDGWSMKIYKDSDLKYIFEQLIKFGRQKQIWEVKKVLEIIDPIV